MAEHDDPATAAARLEMALERIASRPRPVPAPPPPDTSMVTARLDALIMRVRGALTGPADG